MSFDRKDRTWWMGAWAWVFPAGPVAGLREKGRPARAWGLACALSIASLLTGCGASSFSRQAQSTEALLAARQTRDRQVAHYLADATARLLEQVRARHEAFVAGETDRPPEVHVLMISGGGDWGAFGAGFLKGWSRVPAGPMALPRFDVVTGVSTGALIAPFAFLGEAADLDTVLKVYRNPQKDWMRARGLWAMLRGSSAYADIPGLEEELRTAISPKRIDRLVAAGDAGRLLAVNLTNIDTQEMQIWDVIGEAQRVQTGGSVDRFHAVLLASAALPGVMPPREIDGALYVDGGLTGNILFGGPYVRPHEDTFVARWCERYPDLPVPPIRYWIIFNNELRWLPEVVPAKWSAILARGMTASTRSATLNSMRLLLLQADLARLQYGADVQVRIVAVPDGWVAPTDRPFDPKTMNALADLGEAMGADPGSWQQSVPLMRLEEAP